MSGDVENVVDSTHHPDISVFVLTSTIARKVTALDRAEVGILESLMIPIQRSQHGRPWLTHHQQATTVGRQALTVFGDDIRNNTGQRSRAASWLRRGDAG